VDVVRLGILGGTFDPIHQGHLSLAQSAYQALALDKILFVPAGDPPHKQDRQLIAAHHRLNMVKLAVEGQPHFEISRVDLDRPGPHYTVDMVTHLRADYGVAADDCFLIIGTDSLIDLPTWHAPQRLLSLCWLAVIHRPGYRPNLDDLASQLPGLRQSITWVEMPADPVSSSQLRRQLAHSGHDRQTREEIPEAVWTYIQQMGLYK